MNNLKKRILTSVIALPLSICLLIIGDFPLAFFLVFILFVGIYELFTVFKKTSTKVFLFLILTLSLFSTYYLREVASLFLYFAIAISISSDIGGYVFGKIFKWKKLTKISPNKTFSGVFGSYFFSLFCLYAFNQYYLEAKQYAGLNEFYKDIMVNFEYSDRPEDYQASSILYIGGGNSIENSYVQDLIEWRHKQGYIVYTASESAVGGSSGDIIN